MKQIFELFYVHVYPFSYIYWAEVFDQVRILLDGRVDGNTADESCLFNWQFSIQKHFKSSL